ncbi:MAG: glutamate ligase domain-containing protein [Alistipes inops]
MNGRFDTLHSPDGITAIVDYAHTPDALRNVMDTVNKPAAVRATIVVVGCAAPRPHQMPVMAQIAAEGADRRFTSDNRAMKTRTLPSEMTATLPDTDGG